MTKFLNSPERLRIVTLFQNFREDQFSWIRAAPAVHVFDVGQMDAPDDPPEDEHVEVRVGDAVGDRPRGQEKQQDDPGDQQRLDDEQAGHSGGGAGQDTRRYSVSL